MKFFLWNHSINSLILTRRMNWWYLINKKKKIIMWIHIYPNWKMYFNFANGRKRSFSYKTKASISFFPMRRMCLWCLIIKRKGIITWICVCPNWQMNINSKNGWKRSFSYETKASISFISMKRMCLWCPIMKKNEIIMWIRVCPNWRMSINSKNRGKKVFLMKPKH